MEQFTYVKRGYDPEEVDKYISTMEQVIKSYKDKDNAIKNAIISAQVAADNMVKNAKAQADEYKGRIAKELDKVTEEVARQRMKIQAFSDVYKGLVRKYLAELDDNDMSDLSARLDEVDAFIKRLKEVDIVPAPTPTPVSDLPSDYPPRPAAVSDYADDYPPRPAAAESSSNPVPKKPHTPPPAPVLSLGPSSSPSLNKTPMMPSGMQKPYSPPQVVARINDDGNYVPSS